MTQAATFDAISPVRWGKAIALAVVALVLAAVVAGGVIWMLVASAAMGGPLTQGGHVENQTDVDLYVRDWPFGERGRSADPPRTLVEPGGSLSFSCGLFREFDLADARGRPLDLFLPCPAEYGEPVVVTEADLPGR